MAFIPLRASAKQDDLIDRKQRLWGCLGTATQPNTRRGPRWGGDTNTALHIPTVVDDISRPPQRCARTLGAELSATTACSRNTPNILGRSHTLINSRSRTPAKRQIWHNERLIRHGTETKYRERTPGGVRGVVELCKYIPTLATIGHQWSLPYTT